MKRSFLLLAVVLCTIFTGRAVAQDYETLVNWDFSTYASGDFGQSATEAKKVNGTSVFALTTPGLERILVQGNFSFSGSGLFQGGGGHRYFCITDMKEGQLVTIHASTTAGNAGSPTFNLISTNADVVTTEEANTYIFKMTADGTLDLQLGRYYTITSLTIDSPISYEITTQWDFSTYASGDFGQSATEAKKVNGTSVFALTTPGLERILVQGNFSFSGSGLFQGGGGHRYFCITDMKSDQIITIHASTTAGNAGSPTFNLISTNADVVATEEANTYIFKMTADGTLDLQLGRYYTITDLIIESKSGAVIEPRVSISAVRGVGRLVQMSTDTPDATIKYTIGEDATEYVYSEPVLITETSVFNAYSEKNGKTSGITVQTIEAGTTIAVNAPNVSLTGISAEGQIYTVTYNNSSVLLNPISTLSYTLPDGTTGEYTAPITVATSGYLTITASAEGYDSAETSIFVDSRMNWVATKSWDFTNLSQTTIDKMVADELWVAAYNEETSKLTSITRTGGVWTYSDETTVDEFEGLTIGYNDMILYFDENGKCTGLHNQSNGGRAVTVIGTEVGQIVEFVIDGVSYFVVSTSTSCAYNQTRYTKLQQIKVYTPDMIIDADTKQLGSEVAGNLTINYSADIDLADLKSLKVLNEAKFVCTFNGTTAMSFPYIPTSIVDETGAELAIGTDVFLREWSTSASDFADATRIIAARGYVVDVLPALRGKAISFKASGVTLGTAPGTQTVPATGYAMRVNRVLAKTAVEGISYIINAEGTAFVKTTDANVAAFSAFMRVNEEASATLDLIEIALHPVAVAAQQAESMAVFAVEGGLAIKTAESTMVHVYAIDGTLVAKENVQGETTISLAPGIYLINGTKAVVW